MEKTYDRKKSIKNNRITYIENCRYGGLENLEIAFFESGEGVVISIRHPDKLNVINMKKEQAVSLFRDILKDLES